MPPRLHFQLRHPRCAEGTLPERAILLWQSFASPFLRLGCLCTEGDDPRGPEAVRAPGLSAKPPSSIPSSTRSWEDRGTTVSWKTK